MARVLIPLADGVEEMEAVIAVDTLRRAKWDVTTAGLRDGVVTASRGVRLVPDTTWQAIEPDDFDVLLIPGGGAGVENLRKDARILEGIRRFHETGKWVAAVCAGPLVLQEAGILKGKKVTSHPGVAEELVSCQRSDEPVVVDGRLVTSQGAGTSFLFALELITRLEGEAVARTVAGGMVVPFPGEAEPR